MGIKRRPYVPGRDPRSSRPEPVAPLLPLREEDAREHPYLARGVALFRDDYAWEAHEVWEELWRALPRGAVRTYVQGLIQCAAAVVTLQRGNDAACAKLLDRAQRKLSPEVGARLGLCVAVSEHSISIAPYPSERAVAPSPVTGA